jgi:hypothetical protein
MRVRSSARALAQKDCAKDSQRIQRLSRGNEIPNRRMSFLLRSAKWRGHGFGVFLNDTMALVGKMVDEEVKSTRNSG